MICEKIERALSSYAACEITEHGARVQTHCLYPSFDPVSVFVVGHGDGFIVHDGALAASAGWVHGRDKAITDKSLKKAAKRFGIDVNSGQLRVKIEAADWLESAILSVANAASYAANAALEQYARVVENRLQSQIYHELIQAVTWKHVAKEIEMSGSSGRRYHFDFGITLSGGKLIPIDAVVPHPNSITSKYVAFADTQEVFGHNGLAVHDGDLAAPDVALLSSVVKLVPAEALRLNLARTLELHRRIQ